ncbi:toxin glutamine deamidase domain-containing protein [Parasphingorhabdus cellanae]|uniref:Tox-PL domain-containing protein n=1 Tax=Parasphingorhabdus cellanae TaxID=2806553 RepID=A0ABX7T410_9SPHN|nr:toxin glutamine deamidase domain-containing protein [Parasphingorhabdus cellanae]QTD55550.1 hypothetical protein J4G78_15305 [Parasphingorhabdus cellanae]
MNQINPDSFIAQNTTTLPPADAARIENSGFTFAEPGQGISQDQWIDQARISDNPEVRAQYDAFVQLAGGRTDNPAIKQVMQRYHALITAETASERIAAERNWTEQISTTLGQFDPLNRLLDAVQPQLADLGRTAGLENTEWGESLQRTLDTPGTMSAFRNGLSAGMLDGAQDMVVGIATLAGRTLQYGADNSLAGHAGDYLRGVTGALPDFAETILPSAARGQESTAALGQIGSNIGTYMAAIAQDPGKLPSDVLNAIDGAWDSLRDSHAAAAAQGPEAEAQWWGQTIGRVTFEVAATLVPVAGQIGKVDTVADTARALDGIGDATRLANRLDEIGDVARLDSQLAASARNLSDEAAGTIRNVNPGHPMPGRTQNCVNCSIATDATLDGRASAAMPSSGPVGLDVLQTRFGAQFSGAMTEASITATMEAAGNGARGIVFGYRGPNQVGHVFNVVNQNGTIRFLDGQIGQQAVTSGYNSLHLLRTN